MTFLSELNTRNRTGTPVAIASVCSAHPDVLAAALLLAQAQNQAILVEATSNQVNQFGGYTGMQPQDFIRFVLRIAHKNNVNPALLHFGGDHLGPQAWRNEPATTAMQKAADLVQAYVEAGFTKIHLDCSEGCAGEAAQVDDATAASRAAQLAATCEAHAPNAAQINYVIGTEVPPPGGARLEANDQGVDSTSPDRAYHTLACHRQAFERAGVGNAWSRITGLVVQPGLEFAPLHIQHFAMESPNHLSAALADEPHICFEAHSTDYQHDAVFAELARRHFTVLKVGPALTFAYRQALYALDQIRAIVVPRERKTCLASAMEALMLAAPKNWQQHYAGNETELRIQRHFSYADRIRYFWPVPKAQQAVAELFADLDCPRPATPVLQQFVAPAIIDRASALESQASGWARALVFAQIQRVLQPYLLA